MKLLIMISAFFILSACQMNQENLSPVDLSSQASAPETVSLKIENYNPQPGNKLQNIFVSNFSIKVNRGRLEWSSARDGLSDTLKTSTFNVYGFNTDDSESVVPGFADFVLYGAGINLSNYGQLACSGAKMGSSSNDLLVYNDARNGGASRTLGLRDCQKAYLGLNMSKFDNNSNGIPDYVELRCGMNPLNSSTAFTSTAGDGVANIDKCKMNLPISESISSATSQAYGYKYKQTTNGDLSMNFLVSNIPILKGGDENFIAIYITEVDVNTGASSLYTAFAILKSGYNGKVLQVAYWATNPANFQNQELSVPSIP